MPLQESYRVEAVSKYQNLCNSEMATLLQLGGVERRQSLSHRFECGSLPECWEGWREGQVWLVTSMLRGVERRVAVANNLNAARSEEKAESQS